MSEKIVRVKYKCLHPSCIVNCKEGVISVDKDFYAELLAACEAEDVFRSPRGACRLGFSQQFRVLDIEEIDREALSAAMETGEERATGINTENPIDLLMAEHKKILETLTEVERHLRRRDVDGLWASTAALENEIALHSVQKEEDILFPLVRERLPLAESLVAIVKEDHRELVTLLHSFRNALVDSDILDGLARSIIVNLQNHIRKEDAEFFSLLDKSFDMETKRLILDGMKKAEEQFVPQEPGDRLKAKERSTAKARGAFDDAASAAREATFADATSGGGCCHE